MTDPTRTPQRVRYGGWALAAVILGLAGYSGYVVYPRFDLPAGAGAGLLVLATAAGVASFFSPCSFPLLVTMFARPLAAGGETGRRLPVDLRRFEPGLHGVLRNQVALRRQRPLAGFVLFGFVYLLAGFG